LKSNSPWRTKALERSELRLDCNALCSCGVDNEPAVKLDCSGCLLGCAAVVTAGRGYCCWPKPVGIRVQSENDL
jgi:hypothetical protein